MKILIATSTFPTRDLDGSRPRFIYDLAAALSVHASVVVLCPHHLGAAREEDMGRVVVKRFRYWWPESVQRLAPGMMQQLRGSFLARLQVLPFMSSQLWAMWQASKHGQIDILNAHWLVPQGVGAALVHRLLRGKFMLALHVHAGDVYLLAKLPFGGQLARWVHSRVAVTFADGSHVRDTLDSLLGYPSGALLQPMGVHRETFGREGRSCPLPAASWPDGYLMFVGRFVEKKGIPYLLRAMPHVLEAMPDLRLVLIGDGPEGPMLRRMVAELGLEQRVIFEGAQSHDIVANWLAHCRVAVVPSIIDSYGETEGMPTVVIEAMAAGVPVVGTAVAGIPDVIVHGHNGWLCVQRNSTALAEAILNGLDQPRQPIEIAAVETGRRFEWSNVAQRYMDALEKAMPADGAA